MGDRVLCHSGYKYPQEPRAICRQQERLAIERIHDRWQAPGGPSFVVEVEDGRMFELNYDERLDEWTVQQI
jgi:hypothetical protein